ncbi:hypothetical protein [Bacillus sp. ISL-47]|uniref:hypothetical protein n=1 Tax=Bacillus sp. ISL-47 TaxID=2819130 RepID=UPI001BE883D1|nr:hypothetical protein [Bacillus sp. ISL-47]MBT2710476.1 hypothetical protein [Pseudomonas sp. ISL-84]
MEYIMLALLGLSIALFLISIFLKDPYKELREDIDQISIQQIQEMYQIKQKLKVLEEELLVADDSLQPPFSVKSTPPPIEKKEVHEIIKNQVVMLAQQGLSVDQIARQSSLSPQEVKAIQTEMKFRGQSYE